MESIVLYIVLYQLANWLLMYHTIVLYIWSYQEWSVVEY